MVFTANYSANYYVLPWFEWSCKLEFLLAGLEKQVPSFHSRSILASQQGEAVNRSVPVPGFASARSYSQKHLFSGLDCNLRSALSGNLVAAVAVGQHLDDVRLGAAGLSIRHR